MNESQNVDTSVAPHRKSFNIALWLALIALGVSSWLAYYSEQQFALLRQETRRYLNHALAAQQSAKQLSETLLTATRSADARLALLENRVNQTSSQYDSLNSLYQELAHHRSDWLLSETEYTLAITNQQLQLVGNVPAAISVLEHLITRLASADRPALIGIQKVVAHDIEVLKALPLIDTIGLTAKLDSLIEQVDQLPLRMDINSSSRESARDASQVRQLSVPWWEGIAYDLWQSLTELVRIRRLDRPEAILLAPEQTLFLRENLKVRLLDARFALIQRDGARFHSDVVAVRTYATRYFDSKARSAQHWFSTLNELDNVSLNLTLPDLSSSLKAVRDAQESHGR